MHSHTHTPTDYAMNSQLKCPQGHQNTKQANETDLMKGKRALLNTDSKPEFASLQEFAASVLVEQNCMKECKKTVECKNIGDKCISVQHKSFNCMLNDS